MSSVILENKKKLFLPYLNADGTSVVPRPNTRWLCVTMLARALAIISTDTGKATGGLKASRVKLLTQIIIL